MTVANLATGDDITETWTDSVTNDVNGATTDITAMKASWTSFTPTTGNISSGTPSGFYLYIGKTLHIGVAVSGGTATANGAITFTLPLSLSVTAMTFPLSALSGTAGSVVTANASGTTITIYKDNAGTTFTAGNSVSGYRAAGVVTAT